jgi:hypothetical protein
MANRIDCANAGTINPGHTARLSWLLPRVAMTISIYLGEGGSNYCALHQEGKVVDHYPYRGGHPSPYTSRKKGRVASDCHPSALN